jgi:hypothetical protein
MNLHTIIAAACLFSPLLAEADARTFTNTEGKKIDAELVGVENEAAILKLAGGRQAKVPLKSLSEGDQTYARKWQKENKDRISASDVRLEIEKNSKRIKSTSSGGGGGRRGGSTTRKKSSTTEISYTCTLKNYSPRTIADIKASYTIYKRISTRGANGSDSGTKEIVGTAEVGTLEPNGKTDFASDIVECVDSSEKGGRGGSKSQRESVVGFVVTLSSGGKEFLKQSHPANLLDRMAEEEARRKARERKD